MSPEQEGTAVHAWNDIRHAVRTLRRQPGFAAAAILPIALGVGLNTGVFSILNNAVFRPLPAPNAEDLVSIYQDFRGVKGRQVHGARSMFSMPEYQRYRDSVQTLSGLMAYSMDRRMTLGGESPQEVEGVLVTCNYFEVLQLPPLLGSGFSPKDCEASRAPTVVLSHSLWTRAFDSDPEIVHRTISLNGQSVAVVGVAPEGFSGIGLTRVSFFVSVSLQPELTNADLSWLTLIGRRRRESDLLQTRTELALIATAIDRQQPGRSTTLMVEPARSLSLPVARRRFLGVGAVVLGAFGLVLLLSCANVANVLMARAESRRREMAVRLSLGAGRWRLIRHVLTESVLIAVIGGVAGSLLAWWSFQVLLVTLLARLPGGIPQMRIEAGPDRTVFWFGLALTAFTVIVCGLVPALRASKQDVFAVMKTDAGASGWRAGRWFRGALIGVQSAVCVVLLISTGLLLRALYTVQTTDPGFDYRNVAVASVDLRGPGYDENRTTVFRQQFSSRIPALPGLEAAADVSKIPLAPGRVQTTFRPSDQDDLEEVDVNHVSAGFFSLLRIPIVRGRTFTAAEAAGVTPAAIVTEATARRFWPGRDPIGQRIVFGSDRDAPVPIVGVAADARVSHADGVESSYVYLPSAGTDQRRINLLVRSRADFDTLAAALRTLTRSLDPDLVVRVNRLEQNLEYWRTASRVVATLSMFLSGLALMVAAIGVYGVVSYAVSRRLRELGIRISLGATARDVRRLILRGTLRPVAVGTAIGAAAAASASRVLEAVLFGVSPLDPIAFAGASAFLLAIAAGAALVPLRAAVNVDPTTALRCE
jgi:predicted permease